MKPERVTIEFKGIQRDVSVAASPGGACREFVNLRFEDGAFRPIKPKLVQQQGGGASQIRALYTHHSLPSVGQAREYLAEYRQVNSSGHLEGQLWHIRMGSPIEKVQMLTAWVIIEDGGFDYALDIIWGQRKEDLLAVASLGDAVVVSTTQRTTYHLFRKGQYKINDSMTSLPDLQVGMTNYDSVSPDMAKAPSWEEAIADYHRQRQEQAGDNKRYDGHIIIVAAYRMGDGRVIKQSIPYHHFAGADNTRVAEEIGWTDKRAMHYTPLSAQVEDFDFSRWREVLRGDGLFMPQQYQVRDALFSKVTYRLEVDLPVQWRHVIDAIDIYALQVDAYREPTQPKEPAVDAASYPFEQREWEKEFKAGIFRKIDTIKIPDDGLVRHQAEITLDNINTREALEADQLTHHELCFHRAMTYNGRLHAADIITHLYRGYDMRLPYVSWMHQNSPRYLARLAGLDPGQSYSVEHGDYQGHGSHGQPRFVVYIDTPEGERRVERELPTTAELISDGSRRLLVLPRIVTYPHPGAKRFEVVIPDNQEYGYVMHSGEFTPHQMYPFCYHISTGSLSHQSAAVAQAPQEGDATHPDIIVHFNAEDYTQPSRLAFAFAPLGHNGFKDFQGSFFVWDKDPGPMYDKFRELHLSGALSAMPVQVVDHQSRGDSRNRVVFRPQQAMSMLTAHIATIRFEAHYDPNPAPESDYDPFTVFTFGFSKGGQTPQVVTMEVDEHITLKQALEQQRATLWPFPAIIRNITEWDNKTITVEFAMEQGYTFHQEGVSGGLILDQSDPANGFITWGKSWGEEQGDGIRSNLDASGATIREPNRMQLSEIENPFLWPRANSYLIGEDKHNRIADMAVQATPTSEGQFGDYPLVVFCRGGIYLVSQGAHPVVYGTVQQVSSLRANPGVMGIDGMIIFTTRDGLHLISGRTAQELTRRMIPNTQYDLPYVGVSNPLGETGHGLAFLQEARFAWDEQHREVVIANGHYGYHYRYSPGADLMYSAQGGWDAFVMSHGRHLGYTLGETISVYPMGQDDSTENIPIYLVTNPQLLSVSDFKKLQRLVVYLDATTDPAGPGLAFHVFGGNIADGGAFKLLQQNIVPPGSHPLNMITGKTPLSVRYVVFMLYGVVGSQSVIHHVTADISRVLATKLR